MLGLCPATLACELGDDSSTDTDTGSDELGCVEIDYEGCAQLFPPTWDQVWQQTLAPSCAGASASCHASGGAAGSLSFVDADNSYTALSSGGHLIPGDPACSPLMVRLESEDPGVRMPPGNSAIPEGARCSIATWIAQGAVEP